MFDGWESIIVLVVAILGVYGIILWLGLVVWAYRDIRERTRDSWSQTVAVLLVAIFNVPGLLLYLLLRPHETLTEAYERRLETEAIRQEMTEQRRSCPTCQRPVREDFLLCPHCRTSLREPCVLCSRPLEMTWAVCPYCGAKGPQAAAPATAPVPSELSSRAAPATTAPPPLAGRPPVADAGPNAAPRAAPATNPTPPSRRAGSSR